MSIFKNSFDVEWLIPGKCNTNMKNIQGKQGYLGTVGISWLQIGHSLFYEE